MSGYSVNPATWQGSKQRGFFKKKIGCFLSKLHLPQITMHQAPSTEAPSSPRAGCRVRSQQWTQPRPGGPAHLPYGCCCVPPGTVAMACVTFSAHTEKRMERVGKHAKMAAPNNSSSGCSSFLKRRRLCLPAQCHRASMTTGRCPGLWQMGRSRHCCHRPKCSASYSGGGGEKFPPGSSSSHFAA
jgi:hypothetical protein